MLPAFHLLHDDVVNVPSDLLLLKYAGAFFGADRHVAKLLTSANVCTPDELCPDPDDFVIVDTGGVIAPSRVMFLGTLPLVAFAYEQMRQFAARSIEVLAGQSFRGRRMTTVVHGVGYGLDAVESLESLIQGFQQGLANERSVALEEIIIVERSERTARILSSSLVESPKLREGRSDLREQTPAGSPHDVLLSRARAGDSAECPPRVVERPASAKRRVFVAMPYAEEFENVYEYGIYPAVRRCGLICERVDKEAFTGDILKRIKERIESADLMIADLTGARPNVYLEVGYAWGRETRVILVIRDGQIPEFDAQGQRCIYYTRYRHLADELEKLIRGLFHLEDEAS